MAATAASHTLVEGDGRVFVVSTIPGRQGAHVVSVDPLTGQLLYNGYPQRDVFETRELALAHIQENHLGGQPPTFQRTYCAIFGYLLHGGRAFFLVAQSVHTLTLPGLVLPQNTPGASVAVASGPLAASLIDKAAWLQFDLHLPVLRSPHEDQQLQALLALPLGGSHYYCPTADMTKPFPFGPLGKGTSRAAIRASEYCWNEFLSRAFVDAGLDEWCEVLLQGCVTVTTDVTHDCHVAVLSRRSRRNACTLPEGAGLDSTSHVSNDVLVETLVWRTRTDGTTHLCSWLAGRGALPLSYPLHLRVTPPIPTAQASGPTTVTSRGAMAAAATAQASGEHPRARRLESVMVHDTRGTLAAHVANLRRAVPSMDIVLVSLLATTPATAADDPSPTSSNAFAASSSLPRIPSGPTRSVASVRTSIADTAANSSDAGRTASMVAARDLLSVVDQAADALPLATPGRMAFATPDRSLATSLAAQVAALRQATVSGPSISTLNFDWDASTRSGGTDAAVASLWASLRDHLFDSPSTASGPASSTATGPFSSMVIGARVASSRTGDGHTSPGPAHHPTATLAVSPSSSSMSAAVALAPPPTCTWIQQQQPFLRFACIDGLRSGLTAWAFTALLVLQAMINKLDDAASLPGAGLSLPKVEEFLEEGLLHHIAMTTAAMLIRDHALLTALSPPPALYSRLSRYYASCAPDVRLFPLPQTSPDASLDASILNTSIEVPVPDPPRAKRPLLPRPDTVPFVSRTLSEVLAGAARTGWLWKLFLGDDVCGRLPSLSRQLLSCVSYGDGASVLHASSRLLSASGERIGPAEILRGNHEAVTVTPPGTLSFEVDIMLRAPCTPALFSLGRPTGLPSGVVMPTHFSVWVGQTLDGLHLVADQVPIPTASITTTFFFPLPCEALLSEDHMSRFKLFDYSGHDNLPRPVRVVRVRLLTRTAASSAQLFVGRLNVFAATEPRPAPPSVLHSPLAFDLKIKDCLGLLSKFLPTPPPPAPVPRVAGSTLATRRLSSLLLGDSNLTEAADHDAGRDVTHGSDGTVATGNTTDAYSSFVFVQSQSDSLVRPPSMPDPDAWPSSAKRASVTGSSNSANAQSDSMRSSSSQPRYQSPLVAPAARGPASIRSTPGDSMRSTPALSTVSNAPSQLSSASVRTRKSPSSSTSTRSPGPARSAAPQQPHHCEACPRAPLGAHLDETLLAYDCSLFSDINPVMPYDREVARMAQVRVPLTFTHTLQLEWMRVRQGLSTLDRDAALDSLNLNPAFLNPHRFLFPRSAPATSFMESFSRHVCCSGVALRSGQRCGTKIVAGWPTTCRYCYAQFCPACFASSRHCIFEHCVLEAQPVCRGCAHELRYQTLLIEAILAVRPTSRASSSPPCDAARSSAAYGPDVTQATPIPLRASVSTAPASVASTVTAGFTTPGTPGTSALSVHASDGAAAGTALPTLAHAAAWGQLSGLPAGGLSCGPDGSVFVALYPSATLLHDVPTAAASAPALSVLLPPALDSPARWRAPPEVAAAIFVIALDVRCNVTSLAVVADETGCPGMHVSVSLTDSLHETGATSETTVSGLGPFERHELHLEAFEGSLATVTLTLLADQTDLRVGRLYLRGHRLEDYHTALLSPADPPTPGSSRHASQSVTRAASEGPSVFQFVRGMKRLPSPDPTVTIVTFQPSAVTGFVLFFDALTVAPHTQVEAVQVLLGIIEDGVVQMETNVGAFVIPLLPGPVNVTYYLEAGKQCNHAVFRFLRSYGSDMRLPNVTLF
eukprot:m.72329 g.72329  ORF g.72329 m.72329 type:complete len:1758 (+) comp12986_c0_seq3:15-5288(+)